METRGEVLVKDTLQLHDGKCRTRGFSVVRNYNNKEKINEKQRDLRVQALCGGSESAR